MLMSPKTTVEESSWTEVAAAAWNRFWFTPASAEPLSKLRIAAGVAALLYFLSLQQDLFRWFGVNGLLPSDVILPIVGESTSSFNYHAWWPLHRFGSAAELMTVQVLALISAVCLTAGVFSRISAGTTLFFVLCYVHRAPMIMGLVEPVLSFVLFYLAIGPSGDFYSVDAWRRARNPEAPPPGLSYAAGIALRLLQVHVAAFYLMMGLSKLMGEVWWDGTAVWTLIAQTQSRPLDLSGLRNYPFILNFWTHAIVYFELALPILIWNRWLRPLLLVVSIPIWLSLIPLTGHLPFCLLMLSLGLVYLAPEPSVAGTAARAS